MDIDRKLDNVQAMAFALENAIRNELPLLEAEVVNHHSYGVYGREMRVKAGSVVVGHIHKYENMNVLLEGDMSVLTENGVQRVKAGEVIVSPPGTKRAAYAHTDCRWLTIHGTHDTDINAIEQQFIAHTEQEYIGFCASQQLLEGE